METPTTEPQSNNINDSSSRFVGTNSLVNVYKNDTPGESKVEILKRVVSEKRNDKKE